jgi:FMN phosphatase YigB (HAD superfamily)
MFLVKHGLYDRQYVFWKHANHFGHDTSALALCKRLWNHASETQKVKDGCEDVLQKLRASGHRLICFTDTDGPGNDKKARVEKSGLSDYFDDVVVAYDDYGKHKGEHGLLETILEDMQLPRNRCVAIGDRVTSDLYPAHLIGIPCMQLYNTEYPDRWPYHATQLADLPEMVSALCDSVFISYSHEDVPFVGKLVAKLEQQGITPWLDKRIQPGEYVLDSISDAISNSTVVLVVVSEHSVDSTWVKHEVNIAFTQLLEQGPVKTIIPLVTGVETAPPWSKAVKYIDFRSGFEDSFDQLAHAIQHYMSTIA